MIRTIVCLSEAVQCGVDNKKGTKIHIDLGHLDKNGIPWGVYDEKLVIAKPAHLSRNN